MAFANQYELEHVVLPDIRLRVRDVDDLLTRDALFSILGLLHDAVDEIGRLENLLDHHGIH
jgi:DNA-directed RNA polymerase subunit L